MFHSFHFLFLISLSLSSTFSHSSSLHFPTSSLLSHQIPTLSDILRHLSCNSIIHSLSKRFLILWFILYFYFDALLLLQRISCINSRFKNYIQKMSHKLSQTDNTKSFLEVLLLFFIFLFFLLPDEIRIDNCNYLLKKKCNLKDMLNKQEIFHFISSKSCVELHMKDDKERWWRMAQTRGVNRFNLI